MVEVALCPADSLRMAHQCQKLMNHEPWQGTSMAFSYFDSINSEQLWQRRTAADSLEDDY
jgi:hypothetical protein